MSRLVDRPVEGLETGPGGRPRRFRALGRSWTVARVVEVWKDTGCWWAGEGEKVFFRLETACGRLVELYRDLDAGKWFIYRVYD